MAREIKRPSVEELVRRAKMEEKRSKDGDLVNPNANKPKRPKAEVIEVHNKAVREIFAREQGRAL